VAAPSKLTPELRVEIERELAAGVPVAVLAQRQGISRRTLGRWISGGRVVRRQLAPTPEPALAELSLDERLAAAEPGLLAAIVAASQRGSWQASAWILERRWPERWARPPRRQEEPIPTSEPVADDPFAEVDELAARRRGELLPR
jgi:transposase